MGSNTVLYISCLLLVSMGYSASDKIDIAVNVQPENDQVLISCGNKQYYLGVFFTANYYKASEFCRYHGMHLATIDSEAENICLERHLNKDGPHQAHYWLGASDQGHEGTYVWHATGRPVTYTFWHRNNPNNWCRHSNVCENCLGLWFHDGTRKWNDFICNDDLYFVCERRE